jgi:hypothetical protein
MKNKLFASLIIFLMMPAQALLFSQIVSLEQSYCNREVLRSLIGPDIMSLNRLNIPFTQINLLSNNTSVNKPEGLLDITKVKQNVNVQTQKEKSVWLGVGLSALVPGAGEFYAKSYVKAAIFFGVEVLCWSAYAYYNHRGNIKTDEFQSFADKNWNIRQYAQWLIDQQFTGYGGINANEPNLETLRSEINNCEEQSGFSHTLPERGTQQYYELIGKYQEYVSGWPDARDANGWLVTKQNYETYRTPIFISYAYSRQQANTYFNDGQIGAMIALLNHVLSAGDAAWSVVMFNKNLRVQTGMEIRRDISPYTLKMVNIPTLKVSVSF